jgi:signal transduction histidine kinase
VCGERTLLSQIFTNLIDNALTYCRPDVAPVVDITWEPDGDSVLVRVADNGIGIPAEYHGKVFNIFQRLHNEDEYPGTGIGLANVKKCAEMLSGSVTLESEPGAGTTFTVRFPKG